MADTFGSRIRTVRGQDSQEAFASLLGVSKGSLGFYERDENLPNVEVIAKICSLKGVSADWLVLGKGPAYDPERTTVVPARAGTLQAGKPLEEVVVLDRPQPTAELTIEHENGEIVMVPMVEARLSAGTGSFETGGGSERYYAFRLDFLRRKGIPSQMALMRVSGDSMEPEIKDGDVVLIDQNQTTPTPGKLFAVGVENMVYIKEVNSEPGKLVLSSYNRVYPALEVDARGQLATGIRIIGRAIWVGRELK